MVQEPEKKKRVTPAKIVLGTIAVFGVGTAGSLLYAQNQDSVNHNSAANHTQKKDKSLIIDPDEESGTKHKSTTGKKADTAKSIISDAFGGKKSTDKGADTSDSKSSSKGIKAILASSGLGDLNDKLDSDKTKTMVALANEAVKANQDEDKQNDSKPQRPVLVPLTTPNKNANTIDVKPVGTDNESDQKPIISELNKPTQPSGETSDKGTVVPDNQTTPSNNGNAGTIVPDKPAPDKGSETTPETNGNTGGSTGTVVPNTGNDTGGGTTVTPGDTGTDTGTTTPPDKPIHVAPPKIAGTTESNVELGSQYDPMTGITATDGIDGDLTKQVLVSGSVDTSKPGSYTLTYTVENKNGESDTLTRVVTVAGEAPKLDISHVMTSVGTGTTFDAMSGISGSSKYGAVTITASGHVDTTKPGVYPVVYTITDQYGQVTTQTVNVTVEGQGESNDPTGGVEPSGTTGTTSPTGNNGSTTNPSETTGGTTSTGNTGGTTEPTNTSGGSTTPAGNTGNTTTPADTTGSATGSTGNAGNEASGTTGTVTPNNNASDATIPTDATNGTATSTGVTSGTTEPTVNPDSTTEAPASTTAPTGNTENVTNPTGSVGGATATTSDTENATANTGTQA